MSQPCRSSWADSTGGCNGFLVGGRCGCGGEVASGVAAGGAGAVLGAGAVGGCAAGCGGGGGCKGSGPGPVSGRYLSLADREEIAIGLGRGESCREIGARLCPPR